MDSRISTSQNPHPTNQPTEHPTCSGTCPSPQAQGGKVLELGKAFVRTVRHFWPGLSQELEQLPDTRFQPFVEYDKKFLIWWGLLLFCFKLGSRRQLDYDLRDLDSGVLSNANRLAQTQQTTLPVHKTLSHFLGHVGSTAIAALRTGMMRRLIRMKALDECRLLSRFVLAVDGTGYLVFGYPHCACCLKQRHGEQTVYFHPVLEAKLVDSKGMALSMGSEFIENLPDGTDLTSYESVKQDCELKAFQRLVPQLKTDFPQTPFCIAGDSLFACGPIMQTCEKYGWSYVLTFKPGRTPSLWDDFQGLLQLDPQNLLSNKLADGTLQRLRWVNRLQHLDSEGRSYTLGAIECVETHPDGKSQTFAWVTSFPITQENVQVIAEKGGRSRHKIENQGFNIQKNSGLNLEHAYSFDEDQLKSFYYLLQMAHIILQMLEKGSLLHQVSADGKTRSVILLFGSLKNLARRLLEAFRYYLIPEEAFDTSLAATIRIRLEAG